MRASKRSQLGAPGLSWHRENLIMDKLYGWDQITETTLSGWGMRLIDTNVKILLRMHWEYGSHRPAEMAGPWAEKAGVHKVPIIE